ncbi:hypothetical protein Vretimale_10285 [Volvox reticuliferus]|uniref:Uncharacterized protein n=1 Tax=Volvox reticuliferus TaxID=1737510 RepID=A0A8J4BUA7_9CHLO|nr:hypothetical protein Vretifemale_554 [Volvox reticuliferus]GIM05868.1 hypothetical protein Vretimale_10285 [Volvox reticuliferus]
MKVLYEITLLPDTIMLSAREVTPPQVKPKRNLSAFRWHLAALPLAPFPRASTARSNIGTKGIPFGARDPNAAVVCALGTSYSRDSPAPYKWSWQDDTEPAAILELDASLLSVASSIQDLTAALHNAAASAPSRASITIPSRSLLMSTAQRVLSQRETKHGEACSVADAARFLEAYGTVSQGTLAAVVANTASDIVTAVHYDTRPRLVALVLAKVCSLPNAVANTDRTSTSLQSATARDLVDLLWVLSELQQEELPWEARTTAMAATAPEEADIEMAVAADAPYALQRAILACVRNQDFLAPDLCKVVCALGSLCAAPTTGDPQGSSTQRQPTAAAGTGGYGKGFVVDRDLVQALNEEIRYQLTEFNADFEAADLGRLISGMAGLRLGAAVLADEEYRRILMKAVYGKTQSITDKASVDFALSRLLVDDPEARSMHYDSRWTHEELRWLPRRERDKRRILKEGWYRTKWGGWSPGGDGGA